MKTILTYGTFDLLHYGHIRLFMRAKEYGDRLVVGLSSDAFALFKGKKTFFNYSQRKEMLEAIKYIDEIFYVDSFEEEKEVALKMKPDVFVIGDDYKGKFDYLKDVGTEVIYLSRTPEVSTTIIKAKLKK